MGSDSTNTFIKYKIRPVSSRYFIAALSLSVVSSKSGRRFRLVPFKYMFNLVSGPVLWFGMKPLFSGVVGVTVR